jgi:hypothetical protein
MKEDHFDGAAGGRTQGRAGELDLPAGGRSPARTEPKSRRERTVGHLLDDLTQEGIGAPFHRALTPGTSAPGS